MLALLSQTAWHNFNKNLSGRGEPLRHGGHGEELRRGGDRLGGNGDDASLVVSIELDPLAATGLARQD